MILATHIIIAISSLVFASILLVSPSRIKFYINYGFIAAVIASGTYLIVATGTNILHTCLTGLTYLAIVAALTALAGHRLASQPIK